MTSIEEVKYTLPVGKYKETVLEVRTIIVQQIATRIPITIRRFLQTESAICIAIF